MSRIRQIGCRFILASATLLMANGLICVSPLYGAGTLIVPPNMATNDHVFGSGVLKGSLRIQEVYGAASFPTNALVITELRYRPDYQYGFAFTTTVANLEIRLSTTTNGPDHLNPVFARNVGLDETVVFSGALSLASRFLGPAAGPKDFDIVIPLTAPFVYAPAWGNLLVDIRNYSGSGAAYLSGQNSSTDSASRLFSGSVSATSGSADSGADALQIVYTPTNVPPPPLRVARGPYLQRGTTTNMVVRWRTDAPTDSRVQFGVAADALTWQNSDPGLATEHVVTLTNLSPDTKYFYAIGSSTTNLAGGANCYFSTSPTNAKPTRIWAIGDGGTASQPGYEGMAAQVRDAYLAYTGARPTDVWLMLGDNAYLSGFDDEFQTELFEVYPALLQRCALWPTIGNHDVTVGGGDYAELNIFSTPMQGEAGGVPSGSKHYYSFDFGNIHFVCLDCEDSNRTPGSPMLTWLEADLAANTNDWLIAFFHRPPYVFGTHNSDLEEQMISMRQNAGPILEAHGVDLVLSGHSHDYQRSYLLDGHYGYSYNLLPTMIKDSGSGRPAETGAYLKAGLGPNPHQGAVYAVVGSSGWVTADGGWGQHPVMLVKERQLGSMVIDVDGNRLDAKFLRNTGSIDDQFTIIKGAPPEPFRFATFLVSGSVVRAQWKSVAGQTYHVEKSDGLETPNWTTVSPDITATGATTGWTNSILPAANHSFYRVVRLEGIPAR